MMEWDQVLEYQHKVEEIAKRWAGGDPEVYKDLVQHTFLKMHETLDVSKAKGPELEYVKGAIWNIMHKYVKDLNEQGSLSYISLDELSDRRVQVDEQGDIRWPTVTGEYTGKFKDGE